MPSFQIRDVPKDVYNQLKQRAREDGRSLTQEALWLLRVGLMTSRPKPFPPGLIERLREGAKPLGRVFSDSTPLIREDRDSR